MQDATCDELHDAKEARVKRLTTKIKKCLIEKVRIFKNTPEKSSKAQVPQLFVRSTNASLKLGN
jgi:hypothetical protein